MTVLIFISVSILLSAICSSDCRNVGCKATKNCNTDPDFYRNVSQLISSKGYPVEEYQVKTADGYILGLQRIPHGRTTTFTKGKVRPVVFLQHGLLGSAPDWVLNFPDQSLGFILADAGYDVWLGNLRGSKYSRNHVKYSPSQSEFWKFSFDEMAQYDLPAMIEFALNHTNQKQLYYVGHSEGTTVVFALLSERPNYQQIRAVMALGPVATVGYINSPIRYFAPYSKEIHFLLDLIGEYEFLPNSFIMKILAKLFCRSSLEVVCENLFFLMSGFDPAQLNMTRLDVYVAHDPAGTSTQNIVHYAQMVNSHKFLRYDYGKQENYKKYGQVTPPEYKVENIRTPIALFSGLNDVLADPVDVALLKPRIKNLTESYLVKDPLWAHVDFIFGLDAAQYVYKELMRVMKSV